MRQISYDIEMTYNLEHAQQLGRR